MGNEQRKRSEGRDLTRYYDKSPYTHRKIQTATRQHKNATKHFDYKIIADTKNNPDKGQFFYTMNFFMEI